MSILGCSYARSKTLECTTVLNVEEINFVIKNITFTKTIIGILLTVTVKNTRTVLCHAYDETAFFVIIISC